MSTKKQIAISLTLVLAAAATVYAYARTAAPATQTGAQGGHDHAAMAGGAASDGPSPVTLDATAARRIGVTFATAAIRPLRQTVRTVGVVSYDETRVAHVHPKVDGWIERLFIDFTGAPVRRGQPLLEVYSPQLVSAQEELVLARRLADAAREGGGERATRNARDLLESARRRLSYWDIPEDEIRRIEASAEPRKTLTLRAPASGIVVERNAYEGAQIRPGMDLYTIADLSVVWVEGEIFEKDLALAEEGQAATITFQAYPGEPFTGTVTYVYPTVSLESRTGRIRLELENPGLRLRPGMYAEIELISEAARSGLIVPRSAVLHTGQRSVVFVRGEAGVLLPTDVTPGMVVGDDIEILAGLEPGDVVVTSANFLIDAESNLGASMNAMEQDGAGDGAMDDTTASPSSSGTDGDETPEH